MPRNSRKIRYAVVGLGHIAQVAVLPGFSHARQNSELSSFVSGDPAKLKILGRRYRVKNLFSYAQYEDCLRSGLIDAVYIALPNHLHRAYTVAAARAGIHVLCEKPLAVTARDCEGMIRACRRGKVKLMTAYRLHFERANLEAIEAVQSGKIGDPQVFYSLFSYQVRENNIRTRKKAGGGTLYDIGVYCINASRYLFREEPRTVWAESIRGLDRRSREVDALTHATLIFPNNKRALFTTSFASAAVANYQILGTKGTLQLDNAYEYAADISMEINVNGRKESKSFSQRDHFGAQVHYFSNCILHNREPEPNGEEGLADVRIVEALYKSAATGKPVQLKAAPKKVWPSMRQEIFRPAVEEPDLVNVQSGSQD